MKTFSNLPKYTSKTLYNGFNLNNLKTSGWFAPDGILLNCPNNFQPYHISVIAPNPSKYVTQNIYGATYDILVGDMDPLIISGNALIDYDILNNDRVRWEVDHSGYVDNQDVIIIDRYGNEYTSLRLLVEGGMFIIDDDDESKSESIIDHIDLYDIYAKVNGTLRLITIILKDDIKTLISNENEEVYLKDDNIVYKDSRISGWKKEDSTIIDSEPAGPFEIEVDSNEGENYDDLEAVTTFDNNSLNLPVYLETEVGYPISNYPYDLKDYNDIANKKDKCLVVNVKNPHTVLTRTCINGNWTAWESENDVMQENINALQETVAELHENNLAKDEEILALKEKINEIYEMLKDKDTETDPDELAPEG